MRTLGASRRQVLTSIVVEALVIGVARVGRRPLPRARPREGALQALRRWSASRCRTTASSFETRTIVVSILVGVLVTLIASLRPAIRATRVPPIAAVREGATLPPSRFARYRTLGSILIDRRRVRGAPLRPLRQRPRARRGSCVWMGVGALLIFFGVAMFAVRIVQPFARLLGWPATKIGGAAGSLARDNARRNPQRTASTASALMIGLALVTLVAVLAAGITPQLPRRRRQDLAQRRLRDHGAEQLQPDPDRRPRTPRRRARSSRPSATSAPATRPRSATSSSRPPSTRPRARCSTSTGRRARQQTMAQLGDNGAFVDKGYAKSHNLRVGSPIVLTFANGERKTFVVKGIFDPPSGGSPFGRVTISQQAWDAHNANPRNLYSFIRVRGGQSDENLKQLEQTLDGLPEREGADAAAVHRQPDQRAQLDPEHPLRAARALGDRQPVRDRQHARPDGVRADARDRDAARDRHDAPPGAADDPARERDHGADRRRARHRARDRARRAARRARRLHPVLAAGRLADRLRRR